MKAQHKSISIAAINLRLHPHTQELYQRLLADAFELKKDIPIRGDQRIILSSIAPLEEGQGFESGVTGEIARFTNIDIDGNWFNFRTLKAAEDDEVATIEIPENFRPNFKSFRYYFDPKSHLLFFEVKADGATISAQYVLKFFQLLLGNKDLQDKYNEIELTLIPTEESVQKMLQLPKLESVYLHIRRPNPDDLGDLENEILDEMDEQGAAQIDTEFKAVKGKSLKLSERNKLLAGVAAQNGYVEAKGKDENNISREESTKKHTQVLTGKYSTGITTAKNFFIELAGQLKTKVLASRNQPAAGAE